MNARQPIFLLVILLGAVPLLPLAPVSTPADELVVGVNLLNQPDKLTPQEQDSVLDSMKSAGSASFARGQMTVTRASILPSVFMLMG
jgi:hypothetical protein